MADTSASKTSEATGFIEKEQIKLPENHRGREQSVILRRLGVRHVGRFNVLILIPGTVVLLGICGFLVYLWSANTHNIVWKTIVLAGWLTRTITLLSMAIRFIVTAQAALCTSILALLSLRKYQILLPDVVATVVAQYQNAGPLALFTSTARSLTHGRGVWYNCLLVVILAISTIIQFTSTILLSDVHLTSVQGWDQTKQLPYGMFTNSSYTYLTNSNLLYSTGYASQTPASYPNFAEKIISHRPQEGVHDTGSVLRAYPPISPTTEREQLGNYSGIGAIFDARVACIRPNVKHVNFTFDANITSPLVEGQLSLDRQPVLFQGSVQSDASGKFSCRIAWNLNLTGAGVPDYGGQQDWPVVFCGLHTDDSTGLMSVLDSDYGMPEDQAEYRMNATHKNFVVLNISTPYPNDLYKYIPGMSGSNGVLSAAVWQNLTAAGMQTWTEQEEWLTIPTTDPQTLLSITVCTASFESINRPMRISTQQNLTEPTLAWDGERGTFDTRSVRRQMGLTGASAAGERGLFTLDSIDLRYHEGSPPTELNPVNPDPYLDQSAFQIAITATLDTFIYNELVACLYCKIMLTTDIDGPLDRDLVLMSPAHTAIFQDILRTTQHPAFAIQTFFTVLFGNVYYNYVPSFMGDQEVTIARFVTTSKPNAWTGLIVILVVLALHLSCSTYIMVMFARVAEPGDVIGSAWAMYHQLQDDGVAAWGHHAAGVLETRTGSMKDSDDLVKNAMRREGMDTCWVGVEKGEMGEQIPRLRVLKKLCGSHDRP